MGIQRNRGSWTNAGQCSAKGIDVKMSLIKIIDASFSYGEKDIFSQVSFEVEMGEVCCLIGQNGCGKSTLLDCVLGASQLKDGDILLGGNDIRAYKATEIAKRIAYVPQTHSSSFPYTVEQVVLMGRTAYQETFIGPGDKDKQLVKQALELVGISHIAACPYTQISGGELQLVMLARALVQSTPLIIMDEPTAHLDFRNELIFMETVAKLVTESKVGVLMATHSPNQAFYFENKNVPVRVLAMGDKRILRSGLPHEALSEEAIREIYHVEARCIESVDRTGVLRQIIPVKPQ